MRRVISFGWSVVLVAATTAGMLATAAAATRVAFRS